MPEIVSFSLVIKYRLLSAIVPAHHTTFRARPKEESAALTVGRGAGIMDEHERREAGKTFHGR
ncbi:MAG: hypothetical protein IJR97_05595 [Clostridia bacterium]|nr:hypothetical protein [Clostridia bacterium]